MKTRKIFSALAVLVIVVGLSGFVFASDYDEYVLNEYGLFLKFSSSGSPADGMDGRQTNQERCQQEMGGSYPFPDSGNLMGMECWYLYGAVGWPGYDGDPDAPIPDFKYKYTLFGGLGEIFVEGDVQDVYSTNMFELRNRNPYYSNSKVSGSSVSSVDIGGNIRKSIMGYGTEDEITIVNEYDNAYNLQTTTASKAGQENQIIEYDYSFEPGIDSCSTPASDFRLCKITYNSGSTIFEYDERGRVIYKRTKIEDDVWGTQIYDFEYTYNNDNSLESIILTKSDGTIIEIFEYEYDDLGRLDKIYHNDNEIGDFSYRPSGAIDKKIIGAGFIEADFEYDDREFLTKFKYEDAGDTVLFQRSMNYDDVGNILGIDDSYVDPINFPSSPDEEYVYDTWDRLFTADYTPGGNPDFTYTYNTLGDRLTKNTITYQYNNPGSAYWLSGTSDGNSFEYDDGGNVVSMVDEGVTKILTYDAMNRVKSVQYGGITEYYFYDYTNHRIKKIVGDETTIYIWEGNNVILEEVFGEDSEPQGDCPYGLVNGVCPVCGNVDGDENGVVNTEDWEYFNNYFNYDGPAPLIEWIADFNWNGEIDIADFIIFNEYINQGGSAPECITACGDVNGDGIIIPDIADLVYLVTYMFQGGPEIDCSNDGPDGVDYVDCYGIPLDSSGYPGGFTEEEINAFNTFLEAAMDGDQDATYQAPSAPKEPSEEPRGEIKTTTQEPVEEEEEQVIQTPTTEQKSKDPIEETTKEIIEKIESSTPVIQETPTAPITQTPKVTPKTTDARKSSRDAAVRYSPPAGDADRPGENPFTYSWNLIKDLFSWDYFTLDIFFNA